MELLLTSKDNYSFGKRYSGKEAAEAFKKAYLEIKPWRSFSSRLAEKNKVKKTEAESKAEVQEVKKAESKDTPPKDKIVIVVKKVQEVAKPVFEEDNTCTICMEGPKEIVLIPCGHLGFCLGCIITLNDCPICNTPIITKHKVFLV